MLAVFFQVRAKHSTVTHILTTGRGVCEPQQECPGAGAEIHLLTDQNKDLDCGHDIHTASDSIWRAQLSMALNISQAHEYKIINIKYNIYNIHI